MSTLLFEKHGFVATLAINRPETRNALGEEGDGELFAAAAARINADRELRCAIITGVGTAFSAGYVLVGSTEVTGARSCAVIIADPSAKPTPTPTPPTRFSIC